MKKNNSKKDIKKVELTDEEKVLLTQSEVEALAAAKTASLREKDQELLKDQEEEKEKEEKSKKTRKKLQLAAIILFIMLLLARCSALPPVPTIEDIKVNLGFEDTIKTEDIVKEETEYDSRYSMLTMSMNKVPIGYNGISPLNLNIMNAKENVYYQYIEIYLNGADGKPNMKALIYRSGLIDIGQTLQYDTLDLNLPAGTYNCTAYFNAVHPETMNYAGKGGAIIDITIQNTAEGALNIDDVHAGLYFLNNATGQVERIE